MRYGPSVVDFESNWNLEEVSLLPRNVVKDSYTLPETQSVDNDWFVWWVKIHRLLLFINKSS